MFRLFLFADCGCTFNDEDTGRDLTTANPLKKCMCKSGCLFQLKEQRYYKYINFIVGDSGTYPIDLNRADRQYTSKYDQWKIQNNLCMAALYQGLIGVSCVFVVIIDNNIL